MTQPKISEGDLASQVESLLNIYHWQWIHIRPARVLRHGKETYETSYSGHKGFLDYLCLRPPRIIVFELKNEKGELTPEQKEWYRLWEECQKVITLGPLDISGAVAALGMINPIPILYLPEVYLWRPSDIETVIEILK